MGQMETAAPTPETDPSQQEAQQPPAMLLPHMKQFVAEFQTPARTYRFSFDEALKRSKPDALAMRRDGHILSLLQARTLPVLGAEWCVKSDDDTYKDQATKYQKLIEKTPRLLQLRKCLLEAVWFGRYGVQFAFGKVNVSGEEMTGITAWKPVNGDKISFREDGTPAIRINPKFANTLKDQGATIDGPDVNTTWSDQGTVLILDKPEYRSRFAVHVHEIEDADYMEPELAGAVGGVGLRHYCYWIWWLRQEVMEWLLSYLEMMGAGGLTIVGYDQSNPSGLTNAKAAFKERATVVYLPIPPGADKQTNIVQRVEPSGTGNDIFSGWIDGYFNAILTRLIIGQDLSSKSGATGLGSGVADLQASVKECIHRYDAKNLNETETQQILNTLIELNEPHTDYGLRCETVLTKVDPEKGLQAVKQAYDMGAEIPESCVLGLANIPEPKEGEKTLGNPEIAHQAALADMYQAQIGAQAGMDLQQARSYLGEQGIPEEEQLHHLADMVDNGELEELDQEGGVRYVQPGGTGNISTGGEADGQLDDMSGDDGDPTTYAKEDWTEEQGPRGGKRWRNTKTGTIQYKSPGEGRQKKEEPDDQAKREDSKGNRSVGNPRKGLATQGALASLDRALRGESNKTLSGEGVLSHVMNADKRLLKAQVVAVAAQHGMMINSKTSKTRALAFIEDKLRGHQGKANAESQDSQRQDQPEPSAPSGGAVQDNQRSADKPASTGGALGNDAGEPAESQADDVEERGVDDGQAAVDEVVAEQPAQASEDLPARKAGQSLKDYMTEIGGLGAHDQVRDYAKQLHEQAKASNNERNEVIKHAAKLLTGLNGKAFNSSHKAFKSDDYNALPGFDVAAAEVANAFPGHFQSQSGSGYDHAENTANQEKLWDMLKAGVQPHPPLAVFEDQALQEWHDAGRPMPEGESAEVAGDDSFEFGENVPSPFAPTQEDTDRSHAAFAAKAAQAGSGLMLPPKGTKTPASSAQQSGIAGESSGMSAAEKFKAKMDAEERRHKAAKTAEAQKHIFHGAGTRKPKYDTETGKRLSEV